MKNKERFLWIGVTVVLLACFAIAAITPCLIAQSNTPDTEEYLNMFDSLFKFIQENYVDDIPAEQLYEGAVKGLFESLGDPYSVYLTKEDMEDFADTTEGKFGGVGLYISKQLQDNLPVNGEPSFREQNSIYVEVIAPIEGTPAYKAGISAGDFIIKIGEESTAGITIDEVVKRLRGKPGTKVIVTILRRPDIIFDVSLERAIIEIPTIKEAMIPGGIGYLRIIKWTPYTANRIKEAITFFKENNYSSLIIDVRGNPGGLLKSVVDTTDIFLSKGPIVSTKSRIPSENDIYTAHKETDVPADIPIVILIDKGSASASEIFAGALKDTNRATLIGETSFGKGSVQQIRGFGDGGFKITTSRYYTPSGINIDKIGIDPDKEVKEPELTEEELDSLKKLLEENLIPAFIEKEPDAGENKINSFINNLHARGIILKDKVLKRLIRQEINRTNNSPPVYDLEYDSVLQEAVKTLIGNSRRN